MLALVPVAVDEVEVVLPVAFAPEEVDADAGDAEEDDAESVPVALLASALVVPPPDKSSKPAVMVTGRTESEIEDKTAVEVPGSFASDPAAVSVQVASWPEMEQPKSIVLCNRYQQRVI